MPTFGMERVGKKEKLEERAKRKCMRSNETWCLSIFVNQLS